MRVGNANLAHACNTCGNRHPRMYASKHGVTCGPEGTCRKANQKESGMSNTASEVLSDLLEQGAHFVPIGRIGNTEADQHGDRAKVAIELKSRERFLIIVEKVRA